MVKGANHSKWQYCMDITGRCNRGAVGGGPLLKQWVMSAYVEEPPLPGLRQRCARDRGVGLPISRARLKRICRNADLQSAVSQNCILRRHPATPNPGTTARNRPVFPEACGLIAADETHTGFVGPERCRSQGRPPMRPTAGLGDEIPSGFGIAGLLKQQSRLRDPGNRKNVAVPAFPQHSSSRSGTFNLPLFFASWVRPAKCGSSDRLKGIDDGNCSFNI